MDLPKSSWSDNINVEGLPSDDFLELLLDVNREVSRTGECSEQNLPGHDNEQQQSLTRLTPNVIVECVPFIGMEFESYDDSYKFYNTYARLGGFSIRKQWHRKDKGEKCWATFACRFKAKNVNVKVRKVETRCGCLARIIVCLNKKIGKWVVNDFVAVHNHYLHSPSKFYMHRSTRGLNSPNKQLMVDKCLKAGLKASKMIDLMSVDGDTQSVPFNKRDIYSYIRKMKKNYNGIDWQSALDYFSRKTLQDPNFYCTIEHDEDNQVCNCFWVDGIAREDYLFFSDVISFDTTYKKNQYEMPVAPFIGINNHGQSILFGCALLGNEKASSFMWLFKEWLKAMGGRAPQVIFTDQDPAMKIAIEEVFTQTVHRFCIWHIQQKIPKHMSGLFTQYFGLQEKWNEWFHKSKTVEEFEAKWHKLVDLYPKMIESKWLQDLWSLRQYWSPHYSPDTFTAGMTTTQRSESMNSVFSTWFNYKMSVRLFVEKFDDMLKQIRQQTKSLEFQMLNGQRPCICDSELLSHMQATLTPSIFEKFEQEFTKTSVCHAVIEGIDGDMKRYKVIQMRRETSPKEYTISFTINTLELSTCHCWLWKRTGIVCAHMLTVYRAECVERLPSQFILKRWTKFAKEETTQIYNNIQAEFETPMVMKQHVLSLKFGNFVAEALKCEASYKEALDIIARAICNLKEKNEELYTANEEIIEDTENITVVASTEGITSEIFLQDRDKVWSKGCGKRIASSVGDRNQTRKCHICLRKGHDERTCYKNQKKRQKQDEFITSCSDRKCHSCGSVGHDKRNCQKFKGKETLL